jgi:Xaa-Pro aminopeptidase
MPEQAALIIANSEIHSDLYYATKFLAPDPFIYIENDHQKTLVMSDLELDRAKSQARVDRVLSYSALEQGLKQNGLQKPRVSDVVDSVLKERQIQRLSVPADFPLRYADELRAKGYELVPRPDPFFERRMIKTEEEVRAIEATQRATENAVEAAIEVLREANVVDGLLHWRDGALTSERLRKLIHLKLMEQDCVAQHTIVAGGIQGCDPHDEGSGPLRANETIVMDVFPRSSATRYYADMTRTVVKGRATDGQKRLYDTVLEAQEMGISMVRDGADGQTIHQKIMDLFEKRGYKTGLVNGRMQGFFHGTGHGLGLDIHEPPRIGRLSWTLKAGEVVTVEPGLYYPDIGAVRIEDMVLVTADGCRNLTRFPKGLELP